MEKLRVEGNIIAGKGRKEWKVSCTFIFINGDVYDSP